MLVYIDLVTNKIVYICVTVCINSIVEWVYSSRVVCINVCTKIEYSILSIDWIVYNIKKWVVNERNEWQMKEMSSKWKKWANQRNEWQIKEMSDKLRAIGYRIVACRGMPSWSCQQSNKYM